MGLACNPPRNLSSSEVRDPGISSTPVGRCCIHLLLPPPRAAAHRRAPRTHGGARSLKHRSGPCSHEWIRFRARRATHSDAPFALRVCHTRALSSSSVRVLRAAAANAGMTDGHEE
ncbi:hypothetical protein FQA47_024329 [Oryzias melastigma]|uniref:Uncharacterized protein n=1 Tax=Oryzias melastigma TaxID=30732 RepID=A0A834BYQ5_ORYME|nr:hypothetical protein FQA47_024329 [Oryzias melastigma]